jgi:hypothetical protein
LKELIPILKFFHEKEREETQTLPKTFYTANITLIPNSGKDTIKKEN